MVDTCRYPDLSLTIKSTTLIALAPIFWQNPITTYHLMGGIITNVVSGAVTGEGRTGRCRRIGWTVPRATARRVGRQGPLEPAALAQSEAQVAQRQESLPRRPHSTRPWHRCRVRAEDRW